MIQLIPLNFGIRNEISIEISIEIEIEFENQKSPGAVPGGQGEPREQTAMCFENPSPKQESGPGNKN